ncbi:hypothetical protein ZIOFF_068307 [Zingiber officinale]|uniref:O-fucosyltransferase family protein n=1 Tax=Zingiber officinale TaxID=94328 RepID=A0A8J5C7T2_ZINOF|nr:hypothetical protein ZIOFF_068307 [Zingiber officinale]
MLDQTIEVAGQLLYPSGLCSTREGGKMYDSTPWSRQRPRQEEEKSLHLAKMLLPLNRWWDCLEGDSPAQVSPEEGWVEGPAVASREGGGTTVDGRDVEGTIIVGAVSPNLGESQSNISSSSSSLPERKVLIFLIPHSEFNDIFNLEHFKKVLSDDVKVVSSLPSTHIRMRPVLENQLPLHASPQLIEKRYLKRMNRDGVLLLRGLDSRLSKDLPPDLQKLRCKVIFCTIPVAFHALRFAAPIQEFGDKLASRMRSKGPYLALHLRLEKDVWVRTGCLPGLSPEYDEIIRRKRKLRPKLLTGRSNMTFHERKLAGFCPLNALEITRLLKALGTPRDAMIYWAGGRPLGGAEALRPLTTAFPNVYNKESISSPGELRPFASRASVLTAVDYIVCEQSDVFMPSHGGNMGHLMQGHRSFARHRKFIRPNKRQMLPLFRSVRNERRGEEMTDDYAVEKLCSLSFKFSVLLRKKMLLD